MAPRPKRRWRWPVALAIVGTAAVAIGFRQNRIAAATHAWLLEASQGTPLMLSFKTVGPVRGLEQFEILQHVVGHKRITVAVFDADDAVKLLSMPPCPVELLLEVGSRTPSEDVDRLRNRFGDAILD